MDLRVSLFVAATGSGRATEGRVVAPEGSVWVQLTFLNSWGSHRKLMVNVLFVEPDLGSVYSPRRVKVLTKLRRDRKALPRKVLCVAVMAPGYFLRLTHCVFIATLLTGSQFTQLVSFYWMDCNNGGESINSGECFRATGKLAGDYCLVLFVITQSIKQNINRF